MKGLLLKDFYLVKKYCRAYLLIAAVFIAVSFVGDDNLFFVFYPCVISGMIPVTLLGYDERSKWCDYSGTLPYTKVQIVSGKYLMGVFAQTTVLVLSGISQAVRMSMNGIFSWNGYLVLMALLLILSCFTSSIILPFMFRFGVEKGRIAYCVMIGFICAGSVVASTVFTEYVQAPMRMNTLLSILSAASVAAYTLSWYLSIVIYKKREE